MLGMESLGLLLMDVISTLSQYVNMNFSLKLHCRHSHFVSFY